MIRFNSAHVTDLCCTICMFTGSGDVSKKEWTDIFQSEFGGSEGQAISCFNKLDKDGSGDISLNEVSALFKDMDVDGMLFKVILMPG